MDPSIQVALKPEKVDRIPKRSPAIPDFLFRRWLHALAIRWADDSTHSRFEQQRTHTEQLFQRHGFNRHS
jgi:hypothetical protein